MISSAVIKLCEAVRETGGRALLVGGWVRDFARGVENVDYDIEVYGLEAPVLRSLIEERGKVDAVGEAFTVYKVRLRDRERRRSFVVDVSLPRRESKTGRGHRGFVIEGDPWMSFDEAARRRDFTINAMMYDPLKDEIIDLYGGREDISRGVIRVVDPKTFIEDSLRVLRAMQFAARFEYSIDPESIDLCRTIDLSDLPAERIWAEVEKWLLQSRRPSMGLWAARELGITEKLWPEIHALIDCPQDPVAHPEGDVFIHTGMVLDEARKLIDDLPRPKQIAVMLGALCHDFAKPYTTMME
jgi:tRNA nucleotidyltransferase (CCA-adding enzyme)